ncbi:hypothetical protein CBR_g15983 [Chara braunii]|uniref:Uncharacterized protein n=1 Tax=Chara braunii TaxID=69332 RepID=A0A388JT30_CHABU|nr:hypothetical protein CBR_g15983 [Chara braunii]|eukprot:GBG60862.1 hypothetical protein CBR_g15983 [Chara braunii]
MFRGCRMLCRKQTKCRGFTFILEPEKWLGGKYCCHLKTVFDLDDLEYREGFTTCLEYLDDANLVRQPWMGPKHRPAASLTPAEVPYS